MNCVELSLCYLLSVYITGSDAFLTAVSQVPYLPGDSIAMDIRHFLANV